jgi:acetyl/propionyl-CoA carboxylase alpha subunit
MRLRCKVLILGESASAQVIAQQLTVLGYEPVLQASLGLPHLPPIGQPHSFKRLRDALVQFAAQLLSHPEVIGLVHPGTSHWAERPELIPLARRLNLRVIGAPARIQYLFGNQLHLLQEAEKLGIPNLIRCWDPMHTVREVEEFLGQSRQLFPFVLRSARGGGSFGTILVPHEEFLRKSLPTWFDQLRWNLGEVIFFLEKYVEGARRILMPFVRLRGGRTQLFPTSDVSLQCRQRKVVEICPASHLDPTAQELMVRWTTQLLEKVDYIGVGHLEFLVDGPRVFLKSGSSRLNTGFHLWEQVAGTQALAWQLASSDLSAVQPEVPQEMLPNDRWRQGLMVKILAEDPIYHLPRPGVVHELDGPTPWVNPKVDRSSRFFEFYPNYEAGEAIESHDSGAIAHLYVWGEKLDELMDHAHQLLNKTWISGSIQTNEKFLSELLSHSWVREGFFHSEFVDQEFLPALDPPRALMQEAVVLVEAHPEVSSQAGGSQGRWQVNDRVVSSPRGGAAPLSWVVEPQFWEVHELPGVTGVVQLIEGEDRSLLRVCAYPMDEGRWNVRIGQWFFRLKRLPPVLVQQSVSPSRNRQLFALVSGRLQSLFFREGALIPAHEPVLMMESLGVFVPHSLPVSIRMTQWKVSANDQVRAGQALAEFELV